MSIKKKLIIFASIVFGVFLVINIIWFVFVWGKYEGYKGKLGNEMVVDDLEGLGKRYTLSDKDFGVSIKTPTYPQLSGGGFLRVSKAGDAVGYDSETGIPFNKDGEYIDIENTKIKPNMVFYIWPKLFGGYKFGIQYDCFEEDYIEYGGFESYQVNLDDNMKPIIDEDDYINYEEYTLRSQELYNENYDDMMELIKYANDLFDLELNIN